MDIAESGSADAEIDSNRGRTSKYQPVLDRWSEIDQSEEAIVLSGLGQGELQSLRSFLYDNIGKESVIVRSTQTDDGDYKAVVRERKNKEYLRN